MRFYPIALALLITLLFAACIKNDRDEEIPSLILSPSNDGQSVFSGEFVSFQLSCADDISLDFVRAEVDCPLSEWTETVEFPTIGESLDFMSGFPLVLDLQSETCTIELTCVDEEGNESNTESFEFDVRNGLDSAGPTIRLTDSLDNQGEIFLGIDFGQSFDVGGFVLDTSFIDRGMLVVLDGEDELSLLDFEPATLTEDSVNFSDNNMLYPEDPGDYSFLVGAYDSLNNFRQRIFGLTLDTEGPVITLDNPTQQAEGFEVTAGSVFSAFGIAEDLDRVNTVRLEIFNVDGASIDNDFDYTDMPSRIVDFSNIEIATPNDPGVFDLRIIATDRHENADTLTVPFNVIE